VIGTLQAAEAAKFLLQEGDLLTNCILVYNALKTSFRKVPLKRNPDCPLCGANPAITQLKDEAQAVCDLASPH
jgi:molybdopterin-synthase adenylyltransferase